MKVYIRDGDKLSAGITILIRKKDILGGFMVDGFEDNLYYDGNIVEYDPDTEEWYYETKETDTIIS